MKPSIFVCNPMGSVLQKSEAETVASNIMIILSRTENTFRDLTWEEYVKERAEDQRFAKFDHAEQGYFNQVIGYCKSADTAVLFSPAWKKAYEESLISNQ